MKKRKNKKKDFFSQKLLENRIRGSTRMHIIHHSIPQFADLRLVV
jgi:hypothetical protein